MHFAWVLVCNAFVWFVLTFCNISGCGAGRGACGRFVLSRYFPHRLLATRLNFSFPTFLFQLFHFHFFVLLLSSSATLKAKLFIFSYFLRQEFFFERPSANTCLWKHRQFPFSLGTRLGCHIRGFKSMQCHLCNSAQFTQLTQQTMTNKFEEQNAAMQHGDHYL